MSRVEKREKGARKIQKADCPVAGTHSRHSRQRAESTVRVRTLKISQLFAHTRVNYHTRFLTGDFLNVAPENGGSLFCLFELAPWRGAEHRRARRLTAVAATQPRVYVCVNGGTFLAAPDQRLYPRARGGFFHHPAQKAIGLTIRGDDGFRRLLHREHHGRPRYLQGDDAVQAQERSRDALFADPRHGRIRRIPRLPRVGSSDELE